MNNPRALTVIFAIADLVLILVFGFMYLRKDRTSPVIRFTPVTLTYGAQTTNEELLSGVQATDVKDGDVTPRVVIEKIVMNRSTESAVVYYAVSDYDGNVGKSSRAFPADPALFAEDEDVTAAEGNIMQGVQGLQGVQSGEGVWMESTPASGGAAVSLQDEEETPEQETEEGAEGQDEGAAQSTQGPLVRNAPDGTEREIIGALDR